MKSLQSKAKYFGSRNSSTPWWAPSRPMPLCLAPPNGAAGSETTPRLRPTMPVSIRSPTAKRAPQVAAEDERHQPVLGVVGQRDRLVLVREGHDRRDRAEHLLGEDRRAVLHAVEHRRRIEEAGT